MAQVLGLSLSTSSRELRRNTQLTGFASISAHTCAQRRRLQGRQIINTTGTNHHLEELIKSASDRLIVFSQLLKLNDRIKELLAENPV